MNKNKDSLGTRMKERYENRTKQFLNRGTYTLIRIDGKTFSTYTRGMTKPFDMDLVSDMQQTAKYLCENIQGAKLAYVQSDEISLVLTDFDTINTDLWFDGQVQKITSISASLATAKFNQLRTDRSISSHYELDEHGYGTSCKVDYYNGYPTLAMFDSRVFQIPRKEEVLNYFRWRQKDAVKNSVQMVAQSLYSHKELQGKHGGELQELIFQKGQNWNDYDPSVKRGSTVVKREVDGRSKWTIETPDYMGEEGWEWLEKEIL